MNKLRNVIIIHSVDMLDTFLIVYNHQNLNKTNSKHLYKYVFVIITNRFIE